MPRIMCFHDDTFMCLCNLDRYANCFRIQQNEAYHRKTNPVYCENGGTDIYDVLISSPCPTKSTCVCPDCFHGGRC